MLGDDEGREYALAVSSLDLGVDLSIVKGSVEIVTEPLVRILIKMTDCASNSWSGFNEGLLIG